MTALVTRLTSASIPADPLDVTATVLAAIAVMLLVILLAERAVVRAAVDTPSTERLHPFDAAIIPLLASFSVLFLERMGRIFHVY
jgi:hypothetical protein